ncbi:hypothetical protein CCACVL1_11757 [Corchorus capsularis]|uniref:Uncharacterized protein n=1 Tax=Corchorus capsularis TaxID=210143 RepID=A0A1R3IJL5_COCAP|nr:hypothetical protein CCACVL1_11757 [Corchorus capsularis]
MEEEVLTNGVLMKGEMGIMEMIVH